MSDKKNWGHTVLGWFVVKEGGEEPLSTTEPEALPPEGDASTTAPTEPQPVAFVTEPPAPAGGKVDFDGVFDAAGVDAPERDLFAKAQALLGSLPPGTDPAVRRQIVEASLKAFGVPVDKIIEAGVESIQALEGYLRKTAADTAAMAREVQTIVAGYEQKIADARALLDRKLQEQASVQTSCNSKKLEVQKVLEFFGQEEVARVVKESPRLIEPAPAPERKD
ncbi:MAG TPA: hypothetical protein VE129_00200 [Thermoanaerobaculia bacterium]|nr:hypothetical protein [Thermoanaerobaculia bacterium]